jgi:hypothetical protein
MILPHKISLMNPNVIMIRLCYFKKKIIFIYKNIKLIYIFLMIITFGYKKII